MGSRIAVLALVGVAMLACQGEGASGVGNGSAPLTVYSGRSESLIGPLFERFTEESGVPVRVRYGDSAELAATLMEEGDRSPADLFVSQDAAALGALARTARLRPLPPPLLTEVDPRFTAGPGREWVGLSGRARTVVYHTSLAPEELPQSLEEVGDPRFRGRFGIAPANASMQAHLAVYRVLHGAEAQSELLARIHANEPRIYDRNGPIVEAVLAGEIDFGLVNHYYLWRALAERPEAPGANYFMPEGEASSFINVAGAGVLQERPEVLELVRFLLAPDAQRYFAEETYEYPVVRSIGLADGLPSLASLRTPELDFGEVSEALDGTLMAIRKSGLLR